MEDAAAYVRPYVFGDAAVTDAARGPGPQGLLKNRSPPVRAEPVPPVAHVEDAAAHVGSDMSVTPQLQFFFFERILGGV